MLVEAQVAFLSVNRDGKVDDLLIKIRKKAQRSGCHLDAECGHLPKLHPNFAFNPKSLTKISGCADGIMKIELKRTKPNKLTWWHLLLERVLIRRYAVQIKAAVEGVVVFKLMRYLPNPLSQTLLHGFTKLWCCRLMQVKDRK